MLLYMLCKNNKNNNKRSYVLVPFSRQADLWLCGTALAESEEFAYYLDGFSQHHFSARLQQTITSLQDQIRCPEL